MSSMQDSGNGFGAALGLMAAHAVIGLWCAYYWEQVRAADLHGVSNIHSAVSDWF